MRDSIALKGQQLKTCLVGFVVRRRLFEKILLCGLVSCMQTSWAKASDRFVISRDGTRVPVTRSESELAVTYRNLEEVEESARRLAKSGLGTLVDVHGKARSKTRLLNVPDNSAKRRGMIRRDPSVEQVHRVYRYKGVSEPAISTGTINVRLQPGIAAIDVERLWTEYHVKVVQSVAGLRRTFVVKPIVDDQDEVLRAQALAYDPRTDWAQPNFRHPIRSRQLAQDEFFDQQWHLNNTGQLGGEADADIDATEAWLIATGEGVLVGMYDDACDVTHEDLRDNYLGIGHDPTVAPGSPGSDDPRPKDSLVGDTFGNSHGTAVMGLAVANANSLGVRGVAYNSMFTASRGLGSRGPGATDAETATVYAFAIEQGVDVHINSWGPAPGFATPAVIEDAIESAFREGRDLDGPNGDGSTNRPPRGMVIVFAAGNEGMEISSGNEISTLPTVIGIGATDTSDRLTSFSNFGRQTDVLAPGVDTATTDNDDSAGYIDDGFNVGGFGFDFFGNAFPELDADGLYTGFFTGTSASCPITAGVAALVLSVNELLTATDVRLILEHTAEKVSPDDAQYDEITGRSLRYAYGRINARSAVEAAQQSLTNGGRTWPERVAGVTVVPGELRWVQNGDPLEFLEDASTGEIQNDFVQGADEFLVLESDAPLEGFSVDDGKCYDVGQLNCAGASLTSLPAAVTVAATGCALACGQDETVCEAGAQQCVAFSTSSGMKYFAIYARSSSGRYSFGVRVDSVGNVLDGGQLPPGASAIGAGVMDPQVEPPKVTISVSPLEGTSPLSVGFTGNAVSALEIDDNLTHWDFGDGTPLAFQRTTEHTYIVPNGESETFIARLTMFDVEGNQGTAQAAITVVGQASDSAGAGGSTGDIRINIGVPGTVGSDVDEGVSPFEVELSLETTEPTPTGSILQSVFWDLGDGTFATSLTVTHTYTNTTLQELRLPITATVTSLTSGGVTVTSTASRRITVLPGTAIVDNPDVVLPGTTPLGGDATATPACGAMGIVPLLFGLGSMLFLRRHRG